MFLNFDVNRGLYISTSRNPGATVGDVADVVVAYQNQNECVTCSLDGAADALCDGSYLAGSNCTQEAVEDVYNFITENAECPTIPTEDGASRPTIPRPS